MGSYSLELASNIISDSIEDGARYTCGVDQLWYTPHGGGGADPSEWRRYNELIDAGRRCDSV